jgi:hypothetical protein
MHEHFLCVSQTNLPHKDHRRNAAALLEGIKETSNTHVGDKGECFDRYRLIPVLLDIFLCKPYLPRCDRMNRIVPKQVTIIVGIAAEI